MDRQGEKPALRTDGTYDVLAPRDPRAGGTWIGVNEEGVFAALTNKLDSDYLEDAPSRGQLIRSVLEESDSRNTAEQHYEELDPSRFNPFWFLIADPTGLAILHHGRESDDRYVHRDGPFYLANNSGFRADASELESTYPAVSGLEPAEKTSRLEEFCASHEPLFERDSHCLHAGIAGTLSSSLIRLNSDLDFSYRFSQGPPCENGYRSIEVPDSFRDNVTTAWTG